VLADLHISPCHGDARASARDVDDNLSFLRRLLQTYVWQEYDMFPNFPALKDFLAFWETKFEGPPF
jgi:uncharacterized protein Usg